MSDTNGTQPTTRLPLHMMESLLSRAALAQRLGQTFGGARNVHEILGYKGALSYQDFKARYVRQDIAKRIVKAYPKETWKYPPTITEEGQEGETPFTRDWTALATRLRIYATLRRLDILANLGRYAVLLIGLRGQTNLEEPARPVRGPDDILYLTPYSEEWARIDRLDGDPSSETFGQPLLYRIDFARGAALDKARLPVGRGLVHASRVLHVALDLLDDEVYGLPKLEAIYDRLDDLLKIVGGGAEMFWQDAKRRLVFALREDAQMTAADEAALAQEVEEFMHELRNFVRVQNIDVTALNGQIASPKDHFDVELQLISAETEIPKRILLGSERGELSSNQDEAHWLASNAQRQLDVAEPQFLRPLIDRFIAWRAVAAPRQPYLVTWENLLGLSEVQQAGVAKDVATAVNQFAQASATSFNPLKPEAFITEYLGLTEEAMVDLEDVEPGVEDDEDGENNEEGADEEEPEEPEEETRQDQ